MTEELITAADKDRSVPNADKLLTPGSDKAGDLGKAALLPAPDGVPLLEAGAGSDERKPRLLRQIGGYVAGLASRLAEKTGWLVLTRVMRLQIMRAAILKARIFTRKKSLTN